MILIDGGELKMRGSIFQIGVEVTELIVSLKKHHPEILETAMLTADEIIASGDKITNFEYIRRFIVEKEN